MSLLITVIDLTAVRVRACIENTPVPRHIRAGFVVYLTEFKMPKQLSRP